MKKIFALLLALVMTMSLVACGGNAANDQQDGDAEGSKKIETLKVAFVPSREPEEIITVTEPLKQMLKDELAAQGYEVGDVEITVGTTYEAVGEGLEAGTIDVGLIPGGTYVLYDDGAEVILTATRDGLSKDSDNAKDWNDGQPTEASDKQVVSYRALFIAGPSAKGQELEEHYFGVIRPEVSEFMKELDEELWKLGVPAKTKHNEVAPCQHELAPIFDTTNVAIDHNLLTMEMMRKIAPKYGLVCLQHEKPFEGVNGSGKHNNWSISTKSENLLDPGDTPMENLQFMVFLTAVIKAVDEYADLLRTSVATPGNDHRLGANEAPPAIISIFVGEELEAVIDAVCTDSPYAGPVKMKMDLGVDVLPKFSKDTTDRNRTSPFAFTGNKFEFRMPGSAENLSDCNTILNTAVAKALKEFVAETSGAADFECAAAAWVKKTLNDHRRVIFNGNGYSEAWEAEAARRGLPNRKCTPDAMVALKEEKNISLMEEFGVLTKTEMLSRYEVEMEHYSKIINIEARTMLKIASKQLIPAATSYMGEVASTAAAKTAAVEGISTKSEAKLLTALSKYTDEMSDATDALKAVTDKVSALDDETAKAHAFHDEVLPAMDTLRAAADAAEELVDEDYWPLPCYSRMLFYTE